MSVIYIDLGCSDGRKTVMRFLNGEIFQPELSAVCDTVYAFDPIRDPEWGVIGHTIVRPAATTKIEWYECAVGVPLNSAGERIASSHTFLSMNDDPALRTVIANNQNYEASGVTKKRVKVIDFSEWFRDHTRFEDTVILKMDVAGAEYSLLEALIESRLINRVNHLFVNFCSALMNEDVRESYTERQVAILEKCPLEINSLNVQAE